MTCVESFKLICMQTAACVMQLFHCHLTLQCVICIYRNREMFKVYRT